ncbi:flagellin [Arcobacter vandammei]|uniref:flagellin n=1 Tax=Arcobacter vandammei TaxID=2782243 RepID=UPI0018E001EF|nr:flagellin [Arcobacter vandammei]
MQISKIANIDNARENVLEKNQKLQETKTESKIINKDEYKKSLNEEIADKNEVILDNITFGYNKSSRDFFVKVTRGDIERKFPTEDMMRLKAYLLEELEKNNNI